MILAAEIGPWNWVVQNVGKLLGLVEIFPAIRQLRHKYEYISPEAYFRLRFSSPCSMYHTKWSVGETKTLDETGTENGVIGNDIR